MRYTRDVPLFGDISSSSYQKKRKKCLDLKFNSNLVKISGAVFIPHSVASGKMCITHFVNKVISPPKNLLCL